MPLILAADESSSSLLLPTGFDVASWLLTATLVVLTVAALVRVLRSPKLTVMARTVWVLVIFFLPPAGAIAALLAVSSGRVSNRIRET